MRVREFRGLDDLRQVVLRVAATDVVRHRVGERQVVLHHDRDLRPKRLVRHPADVLVLDADFTGGRVEESRDQVDERSLFDRVGPDDGDLRDPAGTAKVTFSSRFRPVPGSFSVTPRNSIRVVSGGQVLGVGGLGRFALRSRNSTIASAASRPRRSFSRESTHAAMRRTERHERDGHHDAARDGELTRQHRAGREVEQRDPGQERDRHRAAGRASASPRSFRQLARPDSASCRSTRFWLNRSIWKHFTSRNRPRLSTRMRQRRVGLPASRAGPRGGSARRSARRSATRAPRAAGN